MIDVRLAIPAAAGWVALVVTLPDPHALPLVGLASGGVAGGLAAWLIVVRRRRPVSRSGGESPPARRRSPTLQNVAAIAALSAGVTGVMCAAALAAGDARHPSQVATAAEQGRSAVVVGTVTAEWRPPDGHLRMQAASVSIAGTTVAVKMPLLVLEAAVPSGVARPLIGDRVRVAGRLVDVPPGDSVSFLVRPSREVEVVSRSSGVGAWAATLRETFRVTASGLPGDGGALLPGISIGDTSRVDDSLDSAMKASGLSHLTAVSGDTVRNGGGSLLLSTFEHIAVGLESVGGALGWSRGPLNCGSAPVAPPCLDTTPSDPACIVLLHLISAITGVVRRLPCLGCWQ